MIKRLIKITVLLGLFIVAAGAGAYLTLTLIIKSEETVVVPALKDKKVVYALQILSDLGLNTRIQAARYSADVPAERVIAQQPRPGAEIKKGRTVRLVISRGPLSVSTPPLTGLSGNQAAIILEENGLCSGTRSYTRHAELRAGTVVAQFPRPGAVINRDQCVDLLLSDGRYPEAFAMAELVTLPVDDAILKIEAGSLALGAITTTGRLPGCRRPGGPSGCQPPPVGCRAAEGPQKHLAFAPRNRRRFSQQAHKGKNQQQVIIL